MACRSFASYTFAWAYLIIHISAIKCLFYSRIIRWQRFRISRPENRSCVRYSFADTLMSFNGRRLGEYEKLKLLLQLIFERDAREKPSDPLLSHSAAGKGSIKNFSSPRHDKVSFVILSHIHMCTMLFMQIFAQHVDILPRHRNVPKKFSGLFLCAQSKSIIPTRWLHNYHREKSSH